WLEALVVLSLRLLLGVILGSMASGIVPLMLYGFAWMGGIVEFIGNVLSARELINAGIVSSLLIPTDVLWRAASYYLQPVALLALSAPTRANPLTSSTPPATAMIVWSVIYVIGIFLLGARL